ncbi:unnamed protein product [Macrosiphum euphorbiae]|uniref:Uncharacterized protein n=1 Tax=Macrosiphum euphorbiae TaxID=13131 RepID=A0AAV0VR37_9HEMI|nr:unnamed protein product [Macrosiphum euphorbiae]
MSNFENENIDTVIKEVMEDVMAAVVSDSIEVTIQSVLQDVVAMEFGYGEHLHLDTGTDNLMDKDKPVGQRYGYEGVRYVVLRAARTARRRLPKRRGCTEVR